MDGVLVFVARSAVAEALDALDVLSRRAVNGLLAPGRSQTARRWRPGPLLDGQIGYYGCERERLANGRHDSAHGGLKLRNSLRLEPVGGDGLVEEVA